MQGIARALLFFVLACLALFVLTTCNQHSEEHHHKDFKEYDGAIVEPEVEHLIDWARLDAVAVSSDEHNFFVKGRQTHLRMYPCSQCHSDLAKRPNQAAHWDKVLKHADPAIMGCETCHNSEQQMMTLISLRREEISFDESFNLCGQCHFEQRRDWEGGAHGKRIKTWAGTRLIENCTGCHDPHQPQTLLRWPAIAPGKTNTTPPKHD